MAFVPPEPDQHKRRRDAHVQGVAPARGVADDGPHAQIFHQPPNRFGLMATFKPPWMPELQGHLQFTRPFGQVRFHGLRVVGCKMGRQLDEGGPKVVPQGQQPFNEIVGGSFASVEAPEVGDDLRKLGTKPEPLGHRARPFSHALRGVDAVVCGVEFQGAKLSPVVCRPGPLRVFRRVHRSAPGSDGPHGAAHPHFGGGALGG